MKAMLCKAFGPPESLVLGELKTPSVGDDEVRVRVHAAGVNFPDTLIIQGKYQYRPDFPFAPGGEAAGEVIEVGANVDHIKPGDRVLSMSVYGTFAEECVAPANRVFAIPDEMDFVTASGMGITYGTTAHALIDRADLQAGETLLVHGASGGVGLTAVEMGKAMGARVIGTGGNDEKLKVVLEHGADHVINYTNGDFKDEVKALTEGNGADVIYDPVGGDVFDQSLRCINWNGRLLVVGFASGRIPEAPANLMLLKGCAVVGVFWGSFSQREPEANRRHFERIFDWWRDGAVKAYVSHTFALEQAPQALNALLERKVVGKAVVKVRD